MASGKAGRQGGKVCICCGGANATPRPLSEFYSSSSPLHGDGLAPICKSCAARISIDSRSGRINMDGFMSVLRQIDRPYIPEVLERARTEFDEVYSLERVTERTRLENQDKLIDYYIKRLNQSPTYRKYLYVDGVMPETAPPPTDEPAPEAASSEMKRFWGPGFTDEEYAYLQNEFDGWALGREGLREDKAQQEIAKNLCYSRLQIVRGTANGDNVSSMVNSYNQSLTAGNLKPIEKSAADEKPLGVVIRDIMEYTPADFFKDRSIHRDVDNIEQYMYDVIGRSMRNTMLGEQTEDKEFSVMHDDEV